MGHLQNKVGEQQANHSTQYTLQLTSRLLTAPNSPSGNAAARSYHVSLLRSSLTCAIDWFHFWSKIILSAKGIIIIIPVFHSRFIHSKGVINVEEMFHFNDTSLIAFKSTLSNPAAYRWGGGVHTPPPYSEAKPNSEIREK
jgi:hypothetical protein